MQRLTYEKEVFSWRYKRRRKRRTAMRANGEHRGLQTEGGLGAKRSQGVQETRSRVHLRLVRLKVSTVGQWS